MSVYILEPLMTEDMVIRIFEHMVICEMRKILGYLPQMQDGQQDGYLKCLIDLFGSQGFEKTLEIAYDKGKPYLSIVDDIVDTHLQECLEFIIDESNAEQRDVGSLEDLRRIDAASGRAVLKYFHNHKREMIDAVNFRV